MIICMERNKVCNKGKRNDSQGLDGIGLMEMENSGRTDGGNKVEVG